MLKLNLDLDYQRKQSDIDTTSNIDYSAYLIEIAVSTAHEKGIQGTDKRRLWGRIQRRLDNASDKKEGIVEVEYAEIDFIASAFKDSRFPAGFSKYVNVIEDEVERVQKEKGK